MTNTPQGLSETAPGHQREEWGLCKRVEVFEDKAVERGVKDGEYLGGGESKKDGVGS